MVTYQIQIPESNQSAFLEILKSLQHLGVVSSFYRSEDSGASGMPLTEESLLELLRSSEEQANAGFILSAEGAAAFIKTWKQRKK